jgi:hypothetical protein
MYGHIRHTRPIAEIHDEHRGAFQDASRFSLLDLRVYRKVVITPIYNSKMISDNEWEDIEETGPSGAQKKVC